MVTLGTDVTLSVTATGTPPLTYQWQRNGVNIDGATSSALDLPFIEVSDLGTYLLLVTNGNNFSTNSAPIALTVSCAPVKTGLRAWWQAEGNAFDYVGGYDGTIQGATTYVSGEVGSCFNFASSFVGLGASVGNFGTNDFSVEFWMNVPAGTSNQCLIGNDPPTMEVNFWQVSLGLFYANTPNTLTFVMNNAAGTAQGVVSSTFVADGGWHHVACTRSNVLGSGHAVVSVYVDSTNFWSANTVGIVNPDQTTYGLRLGNDQYYGTYLTGKMDEVALYTRALSSNEIYTIYASGTNGKCCSDPIITTQPSTPQGIQTNSTAHFTVASSGSPTLYYQWYKDSGTGKAIASGPGSTTSSYTISPVGDSDRGTYSVLVWNNCKSTNSRDVYLSFTPSNIVITPWNQTHAISETFSLTATAGGTPPYTYQWVHNGYLVGTSSVYSHTVNTDYGGAGGIYQVVVGNNNGTATSAGAVLNVMPYILDTSVPGDRTNKWGASTTFSTAFGGSALQYQWYSTNSSLTSAVLMPNRTNNTMTLNPVTNLLGGLLESFFCVGSSPYGSSVTTRCAVLTVSPGFVTQPANAAACDGAQANFSAVASGSGSLTYQWLHNDTNISDGGSFSGTTTTSLTVTTDLTNTTGSYSVVATSVSGYGSVTSSSATLSDMTPIITVAPPDDNDTVYYGNVGTITSEGNGSPQWYYANNTPVSGATSQTLTIVNFSTNDDGCYYVVYTNTCSPYAVTSAPSCIYGQFVSCTNISPFPTAWWKAEGTTNDTMGNYPLKVNGTIGYTGGEVGQGFNFNGSASWLAVTDTNAFNPSTNNFSIEFWLKTTNTALTEVMSKRTTCDSSSALFDIRMNTSGVIIVGVSGNSGTGLISLTTTNAINDGNPHHIAVVRSNSVVATYLDGLKNVSVTNATIANIKSTEKFRIGWGPCIGSGTAYFKGWIDEVTIYTNVLSATQISNIVNSVGGKCTP